MRSRHGAHLAVAADRDDVRRRGSCAAVPAGCVDDADGDDGAEAAAARPPSSELKDGSIPLLIDKVSR
jgi:hypothetical protein